jgi:hypothetical protein
LHFQSNYFENTCRNAAHQHFFVQVRSLLIIFLLIFFSENQNCFTAQSQIVCLAAWHGRFLNSSNKSGTFVHYISQLKLSLRKEKEPYSCLLLLMGISRS